MGHVTLTTPLYGWSVILRLGYDIVYLCTKFNDSSFSRFRDVIEDAKFKIGHVILITPHLRVILPPYAGT